MGQPIHCDATDCDQLADVLVSRIANGPSETTAWCDPHYLQVCLAIAEAASAAEAAQADQEAVDRLGAAGGDPTASESSSDAATADPGEPGQPASGPQGSELDQEPQPTEAAPQGRPRRAGRTKAAIAAAD